MSVMNAAGPQTYALGVGRDAERGQRGPGEASAGLAGAVRSRCRTRARGRAAATASRRRASAGQRLLARSAGAVDPPDLPAPLPAAASWCSMDSIGVTPMPAETSSTGPAPSPSTNSPRGAATSRTAPGCSVAVQVAADHAVRLALDADPVRAGAGRGGQRVAAHRGGPAGAGDPERQVLAGPGGRQRAPSGAPR